MTTPTSRPVPSNSPLDLLFNAEKLDEVVNSDAHSYVDRFGKSRLTVEGATDTIKSITNRGAWAPATAYASKDVVEVAGTWYIALVAHTSSGAFLTDAAKWRVYQGVVAAELSAPAGSALVGFRQKGAGAVAQTLESKGQQSASIVDYGGTGDNATDNATAFSRAEASSFGQIYLPEGTYYTSGNFALLTKYYWGPGKIRTPGDRLPGRFTHVSTDPAFGTGANLLRYFSGDLSKVEPEYFILGAGTRLGLDQDYYESTTTPHFAVMDNRGGYSGMTARLAANYASGTTVMTLTSTEGLAIGMEIGFINAFGPAILDRATIQNIAGNSIQFTPATTQAYTTTTLVTKGVRTNNSFQHIEVVQRGGGDAAGTMYRIEVAYQGTLGQDHAFYRATGAIGGGDVNFSSNYGYGTGWEFHFNGNGFDVSVMGQILSFNRDNATGAMNGFWCGCTLESTGTAPSDAAYLVSGKWKAAVDTSRADLSSNGGAVMNMADNQYLYWGSTPGSGNYEIWGKNRGPHRLGYDSGNGQIRARVAGNDVLALGATRAVSLLEHQFMSAVGFYGQTPAARPVVTGSRGGNAALASLLTGLDALGLIVNSTTA